jgi:hypothetical protein
VTIPRLNKPDAPNAAMTPLFCSHFALLTSDFRMSLAPSAKAVDWDLDTPAVLFRWRHEAKEFQPARNPAELG